jgi:hypothetical protein
MDQKLIEALRAKYQYDMKKAVAEININLNNPTKSSIENIDTLLDEFKNAKDKGGYFESILNSLKPNQENEN